MYEPPAFRMHDRAAFLRIARAWPLGMLIVQGDEEPGADLIPFVMDETGAVLRAHIARANPLSALLERPRKALVAFCGPQACVSLSLYPSKHRDGRAVPTWNYLMIQAKGVARLRGDADWLAAQVGALTDQQEHGRSARWRVSDAPADDMAAQLRAIVGLEVDVETWSGKAKLSQNRKPEDFAGVIDGLARDPDWQARAAAHYMSAMQDSKNIG